MSAPAANVSSGQIDIPSTQLTLPPSVPMTWTANLILNGDAESALNNWYFPLLPAAKVNSYKVTTDKLFHTRPPLPPPDSGSYFFSGGKVDELKPILMNDAFNNNNSSNNSSYISQRITFPADQKLSALIDNSSIVFSLAGWFGGLKDKNDYASLELRFYSGNGSELFVDKSPNSPHPILSIGAVDAKTRDDKTILLPKRTNGTIPVGCRSVNVTLRFVRPAISTGTSNTIDGYADNLDLRLGCASSLLVSTGEAFSSTGGSGGGVGIKFVHPNYATVHAAADTAPVVVSDSMSSSKISKPIIIGIITVVCILVLVTIISTTLYIRRQKQRRLIMPASSKASTSDQHLRHNRSQKISTTKSHVAVFPGNEPTVRDAHANDIPLPMPGSKFRVLRRYVPGREDELILIVGDDIIIEESFSDGWAYGISCFSQTSGYFPMACVLSIEKMVVVPAYR